MAAQSIAKMGDGLDKQLTAAEERIANFNAFVEYYFNQVGKLPSIVRLKGEFPKVSEAKLKTDLRIAGLKLEAKGYGLSNREYLSPEQLAVANSMLNLADRRSNRKKLDDFGISAAVYANWKKDPIYNAYLRQRSESMLGDAVSDVHLALIEAASNGDVSAMKLFYEITGRHTAGSQQDVNVKTMLVTVIESVQKHVQDPALLQAIAADLQSASGGAIQGELMKGG